MDTHSLLFQLEQDIATLLVTKLEHLEMTIERASLVAKFVLAHLPDNLTDEQVLKIMPSLDDEFFELAEVVHAHLLSFEEKYKQDQVKETSELIKHKHFKEASNQINQYFTCMVKTL